MIKEITTKSALHKLKKGRLPYTYDLNIYRGCIHRCVYCYAMYSHKYLTNESDGNFFNDVYVKTNIVENLERELSKKRKKSQKEIINLGGVCDSYQIAEEKYKIMPEILKIMIKYENPIIISTKSDLILRDFDLIKKLAEKTYVNIAETITVMDDDIRKKIEPFTISSKERFKVLKKIKETKASVGVHVMPILPYITDFKRNFEEIFKNSREIKANYVLTGSLNLIGETKKYYMNFIKKEYPNLYSKYVDLYQSFEVKKEYKSKLYKMVYALKKQYGISSNFSKPIQENLIKRNQMKLF